MKKQLDIYFLVFLGIFFNTPAWAQAVSELIVMTHDSFNASKKVIVAFENENNAKIRFLKAGDAGAALNQAILSKSNPMADLFFGVDNSFLSRALKADIFEPYRSKILKSIPKKYQLDSSFRLLPVNFGDVCLNFDKAWFKKHHLTPPNSLEDLTDPKYKGLTVVENPATSSPGLAFLLATIGHFVKNGFINYWKALKKNDVLVTDGWNTAYWGEFSAASKGNRPLVVSYASSPPASVFYSETPLTESPTGAIVSGGTAFRQIEFIGILKGTSKLSLAKKFVDYILNVKFQEDMPLQMFVFPVNQNAKLPKIFIDHALVAKDPVELSYTEIDQNREKWIEMWTEVVLR